MFNHLAIGISFSLVVLQCRCEIGADAPVHPPLRRYTVDLSEPPYERWLPVINAEFDTIQKLHKTAMALLSQGPLPFKLAKSVIESRINIVVKQLHPDIADELRGMAYYTNISLSDVLLVNIMYEISPFGCTGIVTTDDEGHIIQGRILDWEIPFMEEATVQIDFVKNGSEIIYSAITWTGYIGVMTGQRHGAFAVQMNKRDGIPNTYLNNLQSMVFSTFIQRAFQGFLIRELGPHFQVLETHTTYEAAVKKLSKQYVNSPSYLIVSGTQPGEGTVLTRNRVVTEQPTVLGVQEPGWYLVQTNDDWWKPPIDERRYAATKMMDELGEENINVSSINQILLTAPLNNRDTVFTTVMCAGCPDAADRLFNNTMAVY